MHQQSSNPDDMILNLKLKNFYSLRDEVVLDFTADLSSRKKKDEKTENLIEFDGDKFVNIIGLFGGNAAGKSNLIKSLDFCRNLILNSHLNNEGTRFDYEPFKFGENLPSEFYMDFVADGIEYEYSFTLLDNEVVSEELNYYPNKRKTRVFSRLNKREYKYGKGLLSRPKEIEANTGSKTLFLSRASSLGRPIAQTVYRFFLNEIVTGLGSFKLDELDTETFEKNRKVLLMAFDVADSDIVDIKIARNQFNQIFLQTYHKENPHLPFDFEKEESEGTKRLFFILLLILDKIKKGAAFFLDEMDLKLHLRLSEFILDLVRASKSAQVVFTSHNSSLINPDLLRPEQIVFVSKLADGISEFIPLSDFEGVDKIKDIQKAYLQGRFDGVPYIGSAYSMLKEILK